MTFVFIGRRGTEKKDRYVMQLLTDMKPAVMMLTSNSCSDYDHLHTTEKEYFFHKYFDLDPNLCWIFSFTFNISQITFSYSKAPIFVRIQRRVS